MNELKRSNQVLESFISHTLHLIKTPAHIALSSLWKLEQQLLELESQLPQHLKRPCSDALHQVNVCETQISGVSELIVRARAPPTFSSDPPCLPSSRCSVPRLSRPHTARFSHSVLSGCRATRLRR